MDLLAEAQAPLPYAGMITDQVDWGVISAPGPSRRTPSGLGEVWPRRERVNAQGCGVPVGTFRSPSGTFVTMDDGRIGVVALFGGLVTARLAWAWWSSRSSGFEAVPDTGVFACERCGHRDIVARGPGGSCDRCGYGADAAMTDADRTELGRILGLRDALAALEEARRRFEGSRRMQSTRSADPTEHRVEHESVVDTDAFLEGMASLAFASRLLREQGHGAWADGLDGVPVPDRIGRIPADVRDQAVATAAGPVEAIQRELVRVRADLRHLG